MEISLIYSNEELEIIQKIEKKALEVIIEICNHLNIEYFLIGGTTLGAIRHGGFIPWDDDIDLGMTRENYLRFLNEAPAFLPQGYFLQTPYNEKNNPYFYSKLRIDGTSFVEYCNHRVKMHHGIYVDIFPFDEVPDDDHANLKQFNNVQKLVRIFTLRQSPDVSMKPTTFLQIIKSFVRKIAHYFVQIIPYKFLCNKLEKEFTKYNGTQQSSFACLNFPKRKTEYIKKRDLYPLKKWKFDDVSVYIPNNYDAYLKTHYGDYMKLPEPKNRFAHKPYKIDLNIKIK